MSEDTVRTNIGSLLDLFSIRALHDYHHLDYSVQQYFYSRIKQAAASSIDYVTTEVTRVEGMIIQFVVKKDSKGMWQSIPNQTFARKLAFFGIKIIIFFPFHEFSNRDCNLLLRLLLDLKPFLLEEMVYILPSDHNLPARFSVRSVKDIHMISANFEDSTLMRQFQEGVNEEDISKNRNIYEPHFRDISDNIVVKTRNEERDLYSEYEEDIAQKLNKLKIEEIEQFLLSHLFEVNKGVTKLERSFEAIEHATHNNRVFILIGLAMTCSIPLCPAFAIPLQGVLGVGGIGVFQYLQAIIQGKNQFNGLRNAEYYLLWRVGHPDAKIGF